MLPPGRSAILILAECTEWKTGIIIISIIVCHAYLLARMRTCDKLGARLKQRLAGKESESDRVVIVKSAGETTYQRWIATTMEIEKAGGIVTIQMEQEEVNVVE